MEFNQLVKIRRSVRKYCKCDIPLSDIEEIIKCSLLAPSWCNFEPGRYYVALSDQAIKEVYDDLPEFNQINSKNAAYIVQTFKKGFAGYVRNKASKQADVWGGYDIGLQASYLILKASDMGYSTLIMGLRDEDKLRKYFDIPDDEIMLPVIAIGKNDNYSNDNPRKELKEVLKVK